MPAGTTATWTNRAGRAGWGSHSPSARRMPGSAPWCGRGRLANARTARSGPVGVTKARTVVDRWMGFRKANSGQFDPALGALPLELIFAEGNINGTSGLKLEEGTNPSDAYVAANTLMAGYVGATMKWAKRF